MRESVTNMENVDLDIFTLFREIPFQAKEEIKKYSMQKFFPNKMVVVSKNEPIQYLYLILQGTIHIVKDDTEGRAQIVSILRTGEFFPHIGLFQSALTPGTAYSTEETKLLLIPIQFFRNIALKHSCILVEYSNELSRRIVEFQKRLEEKAFYSTYQQIILRILFLADKYGKIEESNNVELTISLTHEELAHLVGTTRETVSRTLTKLKKLKALQIDHGKWILNIDILKKQIKEIRKN